MSIPEYVEPGSAANKAAVAYVNMSGYGGSVEALTKRLAFEAGVLWATRHLAFATTEEEQ